MAGVTVATGAEARCFASYMRIHALEASGGQTYSQMARYATKDGKGTNDAAAAIKSSGGQPLDNPGRNVWISETALSTALNVSYMADQLALFGVVVGIALLLSGIGFIVLAAYGMVRIAATAVKPVTRRPLSRHPRRPSPSEAEARVGNDPRPVRAARSRGCGARARSARARPAWRDGACRGCGDDGPRSSGR